MPARRSRATFVPIPPDLDLKTVVENTENFEYAPRIPYNAIQENGIEKFQKLVLSHVVQDGKPLVIDGFEKILDPSLFSPQWLSDKHGDKGQFITIISSAINLIV
jgi:hypothetical protein